MVRSAQILWASTFAKAPADKPAPGLPSLRSCSPYVVEPPGRGIWLFFIGTKNAGCFHILPILRFVAIFHLFKMKMAPAPGLEPGTKWLTATYSTIELCRSVRYGI